ncbi:Endopeptidase Clp ATP-binding subunit C [Operophtera brumata]|uniref:Endopeptidase Clp ATP-binding subunit C n=1 Tax=Operophtera brumata TaxID=104452 RepID=A0A0L7LTU1_OPEBR|nr:Endopeptidase Clp ATP-binding subunit C [Operophtera brumata]
MRMQFDVHSRKLEKVQHPLSQMKMSTNLPIAVVQMMLIEGSQQKDLKETTGPKNLNTIYRCAEKTAEKKLESVDAVPYLVMQTRNLYRSLDHVNWWEPDHWKAKGTRSLTSVSLEGADPAEIRNGWLTLPHDKVNFSI